MKPTSGNKDTRYFSLKPFSDGEGGYVPDKYRVYFQQHSIPGYSPNVFDDLPMELEIFVEKANALFSRYGIRVKDKYPEDLGPDKELGKLIGRQIISYPWHEFVICVYCCIVIEKDYNTNVSKILGRELINPNSVSGILHACAMSVITLHHLCRGHRVEIPIEASDEDNPDLRIDGIRCEIKAIQESDWVRDTIWRGGEEKRKSREREFLTTGRGRQHDLAEDVCFDIGNFISNRGYKGIRQGDLIFVDLSLKSLRRLMRLAEDDGLHLPELRKHRIIFFARNNLECGGFYIDFDPRLWELVKTTNKQYKMGIYPPLGRTR